VDFTPNLVVNDLCAKIPRTANSPSPELALEFAPLIHSALERGDSGGSLLAVTCGAGHMPFP
jgi:hypothetical protein